MSVRRVSETIGALAGVVLIGLVFGTWWELDPATVPPPTTSLEAASTLGYLNLYSAPDVSAWDGLRRGAGLWIGTGGLAVAVVVAQQLGARPPALRSLQSVGLAAALVSLAIAAIRLAEPPFDDYCAAPFAYAGTGLIAVMAVAAFVGLRRA